MSKPNKKIIDRLKALEDDDEAYHGEFDLILEERLAELDPEWMKAMKKIYNDSNCSRWYA